MNFKFLLGSKMVKEVYGIVGGNFKEGVEIFVKVVLYDDFVKVKGVYFDNDVGWFVVFYGFVLS